MVQHFRKGKVRKKVFCPGDGQIGGCEKGIEYINSLVFFLIPSEEKTILGGRKKFQNRVSANCHTIQTETLPLADKPLKVPTSIAYRSRLVWFPSGSKSTVSQKAKERESKIAC